VGHVHRAAQQALQSGLVAFAERPFLPVSTNCGASASQLACPEGQA
jgi:hypothetical protein